MKQRAPWWPDNPPIYDIHKTYKENALHGPFFQGEIPERTLPPRELWGDFLGFPVASHLGVPAGPLLNSRWVSLAAQLGFDIVTYKTIRSQAHPAHPLPNMVYVETEGALFEEGKTLCQAQLPPTDLKQLAATNSFGIPSFDPDTVTADIARAQASLNEGQVMIVSVVGTPREGEDFVEDFVVAARLACAGGAEVIEADFSCPNVISCEGSIHTNPEAVETISRKMRAAIGERPLVIKLGVIADPRRLREVLIAAARAGVQAVCGINTVSTNVVDAQGAPALGKNRLRSGVCGGPIREAALSFLRHAREIIDTDKLDLTLMGTGGVTDPAHFDFFFETGADVAMSAVGMMWDPYLAARYHEVNDACRVCG